MRTVLLSIISILLLKASTHAQGMVHLNKPYYVCGETLHFAAYTSSERQLPFKVRWEVTDEDGRIAEAFYTQSQPGSDISGRWSIPNQLSSGVYGLTGYVYSSVKELIPIWQADFAVHNDLERLPAAGMPAPEPIASAIAVPEGKYKLRIRTDRSSYSPGDQVTLSCEVMGENGETVSAIASVSVIHSDQVGPDHLPMSIQINEKMDIPNNASNTLAQFGTVLDTSGNEIQINVLGIYDEEAKRMHLATSNPSGSVMIKTPDFYGKRKGQAIGYILSEYPTIDFRPRSLGRSIKANSTDDPVIQSYLDESRTRRMIYQYYDMAPQAMVEVPPTERFERDADASYVFADYKDLDNVAEFFNELSRSRLKFRKGNIWSAYMYNPKGVKKKNIYANPPTFIIDGKVTRDAQLIANLSVSEMKDAELYYYPKSIKENFATNGSSGFAVLRTKAADITLSKEVEDDIFMMDGLQLSIISEEPKSEDLTHRFAPDVYWQSGVEIPISAATLDFALTHDLGDVSIVVVAQTSDGEFVTDSHEIEVAQKEPR
ncbi:MAG: hypothetical protein AAFQ02_05555 [Bacteroidota bacterium]